MKKIIVAVMVIPLTMAGWVSAGDYDLRQYPSVGKGFVVMMADLPVTWYLDVWINPVVINGMPQGPPTINFIPHPTGLQRSLDWEVGNGVGSITAFAIAWEWDRSGNRVIRAMRYPIIRYIGQLPDYGGYYWGMYIGLYELGVRWSYGSYY